MPDHGITSFKRLFEDFAENTTCHGLGSLSRSRSVIYRLVWALIILCAVVMLGRQILQLWFRYRSNPVNTHIAVSTSPLPFPSITICNVNSMRRSVLNSADINDEDFIKLRKELIAIGRSGKSTPTPNVVDDSSVEFRRKKVSSIIYSVI